MSYVPPHLRKVVQKNIRYKALVLPMIKNKYIVVQHATKNKNKELTFIGGGCKAYNKNNHRKCAVRELKEETKNAIVLNKSRLSTRPNYMFESNKRFSQKERNNNKKRGLHVVLVYKVYKVNMGNNASFNNIYRRFHLPVAHNNKETNNIALKSKQELRNAKNPKLWNFMKNYVLNHV